MFSVAFFCILIKRVEILFSHTMRRGLTGCFGGGIYFADSREAAGRKSVKKGYVLECRVRLGNAKIVGTQTPRSQWDSNTPPLMSSKMGLKKNRRSKCRLKGLL